MKRNSLGSWFVNKLIDRQRKRQAAEEADAINNISRLFQLKKEGALTEQEFIELKERMKERI